METNCYWCGKHVDTWTDGTWFNVAPDAASGGSMHLHHLNCLPTKIIHVPNTERPPRVTPPSSSTKGEG